jgi:chromosome segregation ATPase
MKTLAFTLFLGLALSLSAQQHFPELDNAAAAYDRELILERQTEIEKELRKIDRLIDRNARTVRNEELDIRAFQREIDYLQQKEDANVAATEELQRQIAGHDLNALEDRIARIEKEQRQLKRSNERAQRAITRKRAQIEKLQNEIRVLEGDISKNNDTFDERESEKQDTRQEIVAYALVTKNERIAELQNERRSIISSRERIERRRDRSRDDIYKAESEMEALNVQRKSLMNELQQMGAQ